MNVIKDFLKEINGEEIVKPKVVAPKRVEIDLTNAKTVINKPQCPECKAEINMVEGCMTCPSCGYSKCS